MKTRSIIAALLLLVAGLQTSLAQGFRVYNSDGIVAQFSMRTDSIVFYDGIGSDMDFGPYTPVNQCIAGTWYESFNKSITFNEDGTTDFIADATYKFLPYQGTVIFYNASAEPISILKVHDLTADQMVMSMFGSDVFHVLTKTQPAQPVSISCAEAIQLTYALEDGATSAEPYTVEGYITEIVSFVSRNQQTFWMADTKDGGRVFEAYWANLPEGVAEFKAGMKVTIYGKLYKWVSNDGSSVTPEIKNADVVILEDGGEQGGIQHVSIAEFLAKADANTTYELTGTVRNISNTTFGNFDLVEGDASIYIYGLLDLEGNKKNFASLGIAEGDKVTLTGKYTVYNEHPEIVDAQFVSVEKGGSDVDPVIEPVTDLVNGGFESWISDSIPMGWQSASTASSAVLRKSTDAHNGTYACLVATGGTQNKRLATQEITLEAGTYTFSFYVKSTTDEVCQTRAGYVPVTDGVVGSYKYGDYVNISNTEWTLVTYSFDLTQQTTLCLLVMNPKNSSYSVSQDILVDDAALVKK